MKNYFKRDLVEINELEILVSVPQKEVVTAEPIYIENYIS